MSDRERRALLARMGGAVNHAQGDSVVVQETANIPVVNESRLVNVGQGAYNPPFKAQFQLQVIPLYFTEAADVYTAIAAAALHATLKTSLPFFLFGNIDFKSGYSVLKGAFPIAVWSYATPFVYNTVPVPGTSALGPWDATVTAQLRDGDLVFPYTATVGGTNYLALKVVRTTDVPFGTLLEATNSNMFGINMIRYKVNSDAAADTAQFANTIVCGDETMFGRFTKDTVNPEAYKNPEQQQTDIVDIDFEFKVSKQKTLSSYFNYDAGTIRLQCFVAWAVKIE
jgi:hypothetical protein